MPEEEEEEEEGGESCSNSHAANIPIVFRLRNASSLKRWKYEDGRERFIVKELEGEQLYSVFTPDIAALLIL